MEQSRKIEKEPTDLIIQETSLRAKKSNFGNANTDVIQCLYFRLQSLVKAELPDSSEEMTLFMKQYVTLDIISLGSGAIFNMQGFLENKNVPDEIKDLINRIFAKLDPRDLNYRFGPCPCVSCANPALALAMHIFLEDQDYSKTVH
ncbi:MAG: hypothetical protein A3B86_04590 [Candidatus Yanofskybacteria bacterium RIFCSPHIGHO2_02_FULL_38_22b]|uniref:Uncharacterized protein n=1 Tax=Candidatus Yanofskybacteria bacterium RIFCSPHIGHO2_02_FULL_38_22b TaxID=1802673 RepID=A0A1F8EZQ5_9BACT|nr:MAG: hypothetical protein A3B86_04590 [Candidatus Yanofskybacteria bacterium RIFCSPHIGHO2_02_FULL_38_22b]OGN19775.1 MAG: hypothetical protein A2910_04325 [Candidatus Yanofskybacteria bacterium RIFCSPLOWO2_01_FULL_39_28]